MPQINKIELLAAKLEEQVSDSSITDGIIWQSMAVSPRTFYRLKPKAQEILNTRLQERQKVITEVKLQEAVTAAKMGLKTKQDRVMLLQKMIEDIQKDLDNPEKLISPTDGAYMRKTQKDIQAEISKIEGDYAPEKIKHEGLDNRLSVIIVAPKPES